MRRRLLFFFLLLVLLVFVGGVLTLSVLAYQLFSQVPKGCGGSDKFTPADFHSTSLDTTPYLMPQYENVDFPSRDRGLRISGFWIPADNAPSDQATVILLHGNAACKRSPETLIPAGMLRRANFNVLAIDMRNVGDSQIDDGRSAAGTKEYLDLLGAWDWVQAAHAIPPQKIGFFGYSLGGSTAIIAFGKEPAVAALWSDSAFANIEDVLDYQTRDVPLLGALKPVALFMGRIISGNDITSLSPVDALRNIGSRPLYLVHGTADNIVPFGEMGKLADAARAAGGNAETWATESQHVGSMYDQTSEYAKRLIDFFKRTLS